MNWLQSDAWLILILWHVLEEVKIVAKLINFGITLWSDTFESVYIYNFMIYLTRECGQPWTPIEYRATNIQKSGQMQHDFNQSNINYGNTLQFMDYWKIIDLYLD